jgi:hypothetical protein
MTAFLCILLYALCGLLTYWGRVWYIAYKDGWFREEDFFRAGVMAVFWPPVWAFGIFYFTIGKGIQKLNRMIIKNGTSLHERNTQLQREFKEYKRNAEREVEKLLRVD